MAICMLMPQQILDVSPGQQQCILTGKLWNETGTVKDNKLKLKGRQRHLRMEEVSVSKSQHIFIAILQLVLQTKLKFGEHRQIIGWNEVSFGDYSPLQC